MPGTYPSDFRTGAPAGGQTFKLAPGVGMTVEPSVDGGYGVRFHSFPANDPRGTRGVSGIPDVPLGKLLPGPLRFIDVAAEIARALERASEVLPLDFDEVPAEDPLGELGGQSKGEIPWVYLTPSRPSGSGWEQQCSDGTGLGSLAGIAGFIPCGPQFFAIWDTQIGVTEPPGGGSYIDPLTLETVNYARATYISYVPNFPGSQTVTDIHEQWWYESRVAGPPRANPKAPYAYPYPIEVPGQQYRQADNTDPRRLQAPRRQDRRQTRVTNVVTPGGVRSFLDARPFNPPRPPRRGREKEKKAKLLLTGVGPRLFGQITEGIDLVDALWQALIDATGGKGKSWLEQWYARERGQGTKGKPGATYIRGTPRNYGPIKEPTAWTKAKLIWQFWEYIDVEQAVLNVVLNEIMDRVAGKLGSGASRSYGAATGRSIGIGVGPAL